MPAPFNMQKLLWSTDNQGVCNTKKNPIGAALLKVSGVSDPIDLNGATELIVVATLVGFTGGVTPTFAPEFDVLSDDNSGSPVGINVIPLWKPAAVSAATKWYVTAGRGQAAAVPTITGFTVVSIPVSFGVTGQLQWAVTGAPTAVDWRAYVYGK